MHPDVLDEIHEAISKLKGYQTKLQQETKLKTWLDNQAKVQSLAETKRIKLKPDANASFTRQN